MGRLYSFLLSERKRAASLPSAATPIGFTYKEVTLHLRPAVIAGVAGPSLTEVRRSPNRRRRRRIACVASTAVQPPASVRRVDNGVQTTTV